MGQLTHVEFLFLVTILDSYRRGRHFLLISRSVSHQHLLDMVHCRYGLPIQIEVVSQIEGIFRLFNLALVFQ